MAHLTQPVIYVVSDEETEVSVVAFFYRRVVVRFAGPAVMNFIHHDEGLVRVVAGLPDIAQVSGPVVAGVLLAVCACRLSIGVHEAFQGAPDFQGERRVPVDFQDRYASAGIAIRKVVIE